MLPITANPPREFSVLTSADVDHVRDLLKPRRRRHAEALAFLRTLVLSDRVATDPMAEVEQPSEQELERLGRSLQDGASWTNLLPGLARLTLEQDEGVQYSIRIVKRAEAPGVRVVRPDEEGAENAMSVLKVNELERYKFGLKDLAAQLKVNQYDARALVHVLGLTENEIYFKVLRVGGVTFKRYSHEALKRLRDAKLAGRIAEARKALRDWDREREDVRIVVELRRRSSGLTVRR